MSDLRTAAQQALEALDCPGKAKTTDEQAAITALRAALEQPEQKAECDGGTCGLGGYCDECPKRQPEQEPVATVAMDVSRAHLSWDGKYLGQRPDMKIAMLLKDLPVGTLLFTHPSRREWRGLTEEEEKLQILDDTMEGGDLMDIARAIEQALKEKNHE